MLDFVITAIANGYKPYFAKQPLILTEKELSIEYEIAQHFMGDE